MSDSPGNLRRATFHLGDADRIALEKIRHELGLSSTALAIRVAIERLAEKLGQPSILADETRKQP